MANTKKTAATEEVVAEMKEPVEPKKPVKHDPTEAVLCRSVRFGELRLIGPKTRMPYVWSNAGDVREVEYQDLMSWRMLHSRYLFDPMIIIEDETICEEWSADLKTLYAEVQSVDLREIFELPIRQFTAQLKRLPDSMKVSVQNMAYTMLQDKTLYDLRKIEALDAAFGTELKTLI